MEKELKAAVAAAKAYSPRNEGDSASVAMIRALLQDASDRAAILDSLADSHDATVRLRKAEEELRAAQAG